MASHFFQKEEPDLMLGEFKVAEIYSKGFVIVRIFYFELLNG